MNTFKHIAPADSPRFAVAINMDAGMSTIEAELAAISVDDSGSVRDSK